MPATRISKNSSRLEETMQMKRRRSSKGTCGSAAWASTRRLKASSDNSRFRKRSGAGRSSGAGEFMAAAQGGDVGHWSMCQQDYAFMTWPPDMGCEAGVESAHHKTG